MARRNCYRCPKNMAHQCNLDFGLDGCPPCADNVEAAPSASHNTQSAAIAQIAAELEDGVRIANIGGVPSAEQLGKWARQLRAL
jgi:hypothetical protein